MDEGGKVQRAQFHLGVARDLAKGRVALLKPTIRVRNGDAGRRIFVDVAETLLADPQGVRAIEHLLLQDRIDAGQFLLDRAKFADHALDLLRGHGGDIRTDGRSFRSLKSLLGWHGRKKRSLSEWPPVDSRSVREHSDYATGEAAAASHNGTKPTIRALPDG